MDKCYQTESYVSYPMYVLYLKLKENQHKVNIVNSTVEFERKRHKVVERERRDPRNEIVLYSLKVKFFFDPANV